ncbi:MAG: AIR synthase related protein [Candidatus Methanomethylicaceae archaeon]
MEELKEIVKVAKMFKGFSRKAQIGDIIKILGEVDYDDAGILDVEGLHIVVSTDGIAEDLVKSDPWFAGYYSVLVNVNDVVIKGAKPLGYVNVISVSRENRNKMAEGIKAGLEKYRVKLLKGHTHPDSSYEAIDAAVVGIAKKVVKGTTALPGQDIVMAVDISGSFGLKGWVKCFDSTLKKTSEEIQRMLSAIVSLIESGEVTCSRDISAPGILGSLAMLCEASGVGAEVSLEKIPAPTGISLSEWLTSYPAMGFIFGSKSINAFKTLRDVGFSVDSVGRFTADKIIRVSLGDKTEVFMDLTKESVFGLR